MSDNAALVPVNLDQLPATQRGGDEIYTTLAQGGDFLGRLQLYTKGKAVNKGLILPGHYGIPISEDEIFDLGKSVEMVPLARRPKAIDMTDTEALVISYDMGSDEFKRIVAKCAEPESHCQYGPSFLIYERVTCRFLEFFCGNKSNRIEAKKIFAYLPLTQTDIDAKARAGNDVTNLKPHGPLPVTLKVKVAENKRGSWHVPVVTGCSVKFETLPSVDVIASEMQKFVEAKGNGIQRLEETEPERAR